jgi:RNA polymerase sigma factor (sigma-70 family)
MSKLNVDQKTIKDLFQSKKADFLIPDYQRPYAWGENECRTLWDDIFSFAIPDEGRTDFDSSSEYFLGPIVTFKNEDDKMEVIDGQQRLTTLMLLLRAFYSKFAHMQDKASVSTKQNIEKCIWKIANQAGVNPHSLYGLDFDDYVNETWLIVTEQFLNLDTMAKKIQTRKSSGKKSLSLATQICHCVRAAFARKRRNYEKHSVAQAVYVNDQDGNEVDYIENCVYSNDSTEDKVIFSTNIETALKSMSDIEKVTLKMKADGYTEREIARTQKITGPAINKRMKKAKEKLIAAGL